MNITEPQSVIVFEAVRRHRAVSKAAVALGLPQPTVSNALRRLRGIFDDQLFVRAAGGVIPTPFAEQISVHASEGIAAFDRTLQLPQISIRQFWHERFDDDPGNKWLRATFRKVLAQPMKADNILRA